MEALHTLNSPPVVSFNLAQLRAARAEVYLYGHCFKYQAWAVGEYYGFRMAGSGPWSLALKACKGLLEGLLSTLNPKPSTL